MDLKLQIELSFLSVFGPVRLPHLLPELFCVIATCDENKEMHQMRLSV